MTVRGRASGCSNESTPAAASERFGGRVAVVTGGASGIGLAIAERYAAEGGHVAIGDLDIRRAEEIIARIGVDSCLVRACDVTDEEDQAGLVAAAVERFGHVDHAVAAAGQVTLEAIVNMPAQDFRKTVDICLVGTFLAIKHAARVMEDGGAIVTIASINAVMAGVGTAAYNAAKAGVVHLTATAATELGHRGIRANSVLPGHILTPMGIRSATDPEMLREWRDNQPLGRSGEAGDIAALALWLCSDESSFITAEAITSDGGTHTQRFPRFLQMNGVPLEPVAEPRSAP